MSKLVDTTFLILVSILVFQFTCSEDKNSDDSTEKKKPNIILIVGDDIGYNDVGWHNPDFRTPHMDKLAKEGIILEQFYAAPSCTPSRAALLTGVYPQQLGLQRNVIKSKEPYGVPLKFKFFPEILKEKGYATHALGKWHLGFCDPKYLPTHRGFDTFLGFYQAYEENYYYCSSPYNIFHPISNCTIFDFRYNDTVERKYTGTYSTHVYNNRALDIIDENKQSETPFFMYIALSSTHFPVQGDKYTANCQHLPKLRREMCGAVMGVDDMVHNITIALKQNDLYDNSVIVFLSDNGGEIDFGGNNFPLRGDKQTVYEGGTRVPAFIHSPLLKKTGYIYNGLFHIVDFYPTIIHLAGDDKPSKELFGVNQWDSISLAKPSSRTEFPYLVDEINGTVYGAMRVGDYKLLVGPGGNLNGWYNETDTVDNSFNRELVAKYINDVLPLDLSDKSVKLYNLAVDPYEKNDIAAKEPDKVNELRARFDYYFKIAKPAVIIPQDSKGDPSNFGGSYTTGWCKAYEDVPDPNNK